MRTIHRRFRLGESLLLCGGFLLLGLWCQRQSTHSQAHLNPSEVQEIVDRTATLCPLLMPNTPPLRYRVEQPTKYYPQGVSHPFWEVVCVDKQDREYAHFWWAGERKELHSISRPNDTLQRKGLTTSGSTSSWPPPKLSRAEEQHLVGLAWNWLEQMGVATEGSHWQLLHAPEATAHSAVWAVRIGSSDHRVVLIVNRVTGELVSLKNSPSISQRKRARSF